MSQYRPVCVKGPIKIVAEVVFFCGSCLFAFDLVFVVCVEALEVEDGAKYCFQASALRATKFPRILQQDELAFAAGAAFQPIIGCEERLGV